MLGRFGSESLPAVKRFQYDIKAFAGIDADSEENSLPLTYGIRGYNIRLLSGVIAGSIGVAVGSYKIDNLTINVPGLLSFGDRIAKLFHYRCRDYVNAVDVDKIVAYGTSGKLYTCPVFQQGAFARIAEIPLQTKGVELLDYYVGGEDRLYVFSASGGAYTFNSAGTVVSYPAVPALSSVCLHYDRAFGAGSTNRDTIYFSAPLAPHDFSVANGGGSISLMDDGGEIKKVLSFRGNIYVFREYAVHRLTAYTEPGEYSISKVFSTGNRINADTVVTAGDVITFMADTELYAFDGYNVKKIFKNVTALVDNAEHAAACYYRDKLYLAVVLKTEEGEIVGDEASITPVLNNGCLILDILSGEVGVFRGTDLRGFAPLLLSEVRELLVCFGNGRGYSVGKITGDGKLFGTVLAKRWQSPYINPGESERYTVLKRAYICSYGDVTLSVTQDGTTVAKNVAGNSKPTMVPFNTVGYGISFRLDSSAERLYVFGLKLILDMNRRYYGQGS